MKTYWNPYGRGTRKPGAIEPTEKQAAPVEEPAAPASDEDGEAKKPTRRKSTKRKA